MATVKELCWECNGAGRMVDNYPCKVCRGTGIIETWHFFEEEPVRTGVETSESEEFDPDFLGEPSPCIPPHYFTRGPVLGFYKP